jgi:hypothetical protein
VELAGSDADPEHDRSDPPVPTEARHCVVLISSIHQDTLLI